MTVQISLADDVSKLAAGQAEANGYSSAGDYLADLVKGEARRERLLRDLLGRRSKWPFPPFDR